MDPIIYKMRLVDGSFDSTELRAVDGATDEIVNGNELDGSTGSGSTQGRRCRQWTNTIPQRTPVRIFDCIYRLMHIRICAAFHLLVGV